MTEPKIIIVGETEEANRTHEILKARQLNPVIAGMMGLAGMSLAEEVERYLPKQKALGICLNCGGDKYHNNSFCSAECCREFKAK